jgi:hypothetical protein
VEVSSPSFINEQVKMQVTAKNAEKEAIRLVGGFKSHGSEDVLDETCVFSNEGLNTMAVPELHMDFGTLQPGEQLTRCFYVSCNSKPGPRSLLSTAYVSFSSSDIKIRQISASSFDVSSPKLFSKEVGRLAIQFDALFEIHATTERLSMPALRDFGLSGPLCQLGVNSSTSRLERWILGISLQAQCAESLFVDSATLEVTSPLVVAKNMDLNPHKSGLIC